MESDVSNHYEDRNRMAVPSAATTATTPESMINKAFMEDSSVDESHLKKTRKPIGGIAVLPPVDSKRIEDHRKSPIERPDSRSPAFGASYDTATGYKTLYTEEVCISCLRSGNSCMIFHFGLNLNDKLTSYFAILSNFNMFARLLHGFVNIAASRFLACI